MKTRRKVPWPNFGGPGRNWNRDAKDVVLLALLAWHPDPREFIVTEDRDEDPMRFEFVWAGTLRALVKERLIRGVPKKRHPIYAYYRLTKAGLTAARKRWAAAERDVQKARVAE